MGEEKPSYFGFMPANVRYDKNLTPMAKILYVEINALLNMYNQCFATNEYFAKLFDTTTRTVSRWIQELITAGYIEADYERQGTPKEKRFLKLPEKIVKEKEETKVSKEQTKEQLIKNTVNDEKMQIKEDMAKVEEKYLENYKSLYDDFLVTTEKPIMNYAQTRILLKRCIKTYGVTLLLQAIDKAKTNDFCVQKGYCLSTILSAGVLSTLINGNDFKNKKQTKERGFRTGQGVDTVTDDNVIF